MPGLHRVLLALLGLPAAGAFGDFPRGYEFIRITDNAWLEWAPRLNSHGDVVFAVRFPWKHNTDEIMLYKDGVLAQITDDDIHDSFPVISEDGTIVWSRGVGPEGPYGPLYEIARLKDGVLDYLTDDAYSNESPRVNATGHVVWSKWKFNGCGDANYTVCLFDGTDVVELTDGTSSEQAHGMNDDDQIVWTNYDFCDDPWTSDITFWDGEKAHQRTDRELQQQTPDINNSCLIAWEYYDRERREHILVIWDQGELREFGPGSVPKLNNHGDVFFWRWDGDLENWQTWAYLRGELYRLVNEPIFNANGGINDRTDMVWMHKEPGYDIVMLKRLPFGDMNCDKLVDFDDIDGFIVAIVDGKDAFGSKFPDCDWWLADMNDDRPIDFNDIDPFIEWLVHGGCERE
jgi:hypothetical protein